MRAVPEAATSVARCGARRRAGRRPSSAVTFMALFAAFVATQLLSFSSAYSNTAEDLPSYKMAAVGHLRLGVLSSYQWVPVLRHSELGVLSLYQRMVAVRHLELGVLSSYQWTTAVRHSELSCIDLNRYTHDLSELPNDPVSSSSSKGQCS